LTKLLLLLFKFSNEIIRKYLYPFIIVTFLANDVHAEIKSLKQKEAYAFLKKRKRTLNKEKRSPNAQQNGFVNAFLAPFLLPSTHPATHFLKSFEKLFDKTLQQPDQFLFYGFEILKHNGMQTIVKHASIPGYVFKIFHKRFISHEAHHNEWTTRLIGAQTINTKIKELGFEDVLSVPKKWLYPLPQSVKGAQKQTWYILVAEDMYSLSKEENIKCWQQIDASQLEKIFLVVSSLSLWDSHLQNLVFTERGKLAFVDTKHWGPYKPAWANDDWLWNRAYPSLSVDMQSYWLTLWEKSK
jgi:hypothetical protein